MTNLILSVIQDCFKQAHLQELISELVISLFSTVNNSSVRPKSEARTPPDEIFTSPFPRV